MAGKKKERTLDQITNEVFNLASSKGRVKVSKGVAGAAAKAAGTVAKMYEGKDVSHEDADEAAVSLYKGIHEKVIGKAEGYDADQWKGKVIEALGRDYEKYTKLIRDHKYSEAAALLHEHFEEQMVNHKLGGLTSEAGNYDEKELIENAKRIAERLKLPGKGAPSYVPFAKNISAAYVPALSYENISSQIEKRTKKKKK